VAGNPRIDDLRKRLEKDPGSRLFAQLAEELRKEGDLEEAINVCREGLKRQPGYPSARMTLGRALFDTGDLVAARAEFETVLKGAADNILASRLLAECLQGLGDLHGAAKQYRTTMALAPGDKQVQAHLEAVEKQLKAPPPVSAVPATIIIPPPAEPSPAPAPETSPDRLAPPPPAPQRDFAPIPLVAADETFELEAAHEATPTRVGGGSASAVGGDWVVGVATPMPPAETPSPAAEPFPMPEEPSAIEEPAPAPEEPLELERPYESPETLWAAPPPAPSPPPAGELEHDFAEEFPPPERPVRPVGMPMELPPLTPAPEPEPSPPPAEVAPPPPEPAPPVGPEPVAAPPAAGPGPDLSSATLAELYFNQGFTDKALDVYRQLLQREPGNERARARVVEIEALDRHLRAEEARGPQPATGAPVDARAARRQAIERAIARLEGLLAAVKKERP
jgi:tetratricopeptide (TPR) repeat protein